MDATPLLVWAMDADGTIKLVEGLALAAERYDAQDIVGRSAFEVLVAQAGHQWRTCGRRSPATKSTATIPTTSGRIYDARFVPARDAAGRVTGATGVALDVTARVRAEQAREETEEQFRRIVESSNEGIWTMDEESRVTFVNRKMAELLGWTVQEMQGRSVFDFMDRGGQRSRGAG